MMGIQIALWNVRLIVSSRMAPMDVVLNTVYYGSKVDGSMDSLVLSEAVRGNTLFMSAAAKHYFGQDVTSTSRVLAFKHSSFDICQKLEILREGAGVAAAIYSALPPLEDVKGFATFLKGGFDLLKHLAGKKPQSTAESKYGSTSVVNHSGTTIVFNNSPVSFVLSPGVSSITNTFIGQPMMREAENIDITVDKENVLSASRKEASAFKDVSQAEVLNTWRSEKVLRVRQVVLDGEAKWKFTDGTSSFDAKIEDTTFLHRLNSRQEMFAKGDTLKARLRTEQYRGTRGGLKARHFVEQVFGRVKLPRQDEMEV
jgi:hypothetical protein